MGDPHHIVKRLGKPGFHRRGASDVTLSAPKSVSLMAMVGGDERIVDAPDRAVGRTLLTDRGQPAAEAASWAVEHLAERQAVFGHGDLPAATLAREPGAVTVFSCHLLSSFVASPERQTPLSRP